jgi:hypothetical protein
MSRRRFPQSLSISDWAAIGNLVLAGFAIAISLYVFQKQSRSEQATAGVLTQSRDALRTATRQLGAEQGELKKVTTRLATADSALGKLETHAAAEVNELDAADTALRQVLAATSEQYSIDEKIFGVSQQQYVILSAEHESALAQLKARPKITIRIEYDADHKRFVTDLKLLALGKPIYFPIGNERYVQFRIIFTNIGNAMARTPKAIIYDWSGQLSIGGPCWITSVPQAYQCNLSDDVAPHEEYVVPFQIAAPKIGGAYKLSFSIASITANGVMSGSSQLISIVLRPAQP